jgi:DNA-binding transcriptional LysR family regulator
MLPLTWPGVADFVLASMKRQVVAAPSYLARRGTPRVPADLAGHDILNYEGIGLTWTFEGPTGPLAVQVDPRLSTNHGHHLMNAARAGNGITLLSTYIVEPPVQRGELVVLLEDYPVPDLLIRMQIPEDRLELSHVQALSTFLQVNTTMPQIQGLP